MASEGAPSAVPNANTPASPSGGAKPAKRVKKHATVYQKNALYGAYRFWRKKNEDLKARGIDVGFEWKELFEFFGFAKTTGFKVIKDADQDPSTLLRRDETGKVETRGRKPKMSEEQIQAVERMLEGQDPFQEGIEWKVIAKQLDLDVHKHTVRRTIRRTLQSRRKSVATPTRPVPANSTPTINSNSNSSSNPNPNPNPNSNPNPTILPNINPHVNPHAIPHTNPNTNPHANSHANPHANPGPAPLPPNMQPTHNLDGPTMAHIPPNVDPRIMAMSAPQPRRPPHPQEAYEADIAQILRTASQS